VPKVDERNREALTALLAPRLDRGEAIVAMLPFATTPKRPKGPEGKIRDGVWQSARLHRPLVLTDRSLFVFDAGRTPHPRAVHARFGLDEVSVVSVVERRAGMSTLVLELPRQGQVPFELGRFDDLAVFIAAVGEPEAST
jgi:hypothetical protein